MTKKKELPYSELDIIMQATAFAKAEITLIAQNLIEKYEGGMAMDTALTAAKEYYLLGVLAMHIDPAVRKESEKKVIEYHKERDARLKKAEVK